MTDDRAGASEVARLTGAGLDAGPRDVLVALITFGASLAVLVYGLSSLASFPIFLAAHLVTIAIPATYLALRMRDHSDLTVPTLLLVATTATGPVGALGCAVMALGLWLRRPAPKRLQDWYDYIAGVVARSRLTHIHDELTSGRLPTDPAAEVPRFRPILHGGSVEEQQRVLGVIGRRYHADFRPALRNALRNKNGFIRAQAAAVASKLSIEEKNRLWSGSSLGEDGRERPYGPAKSDRSVEPADQTAPDALDVEARRP
jgi:hypothetical protein